MGQNYRCQGAPCQLEGLKEGMMQHREKRHLQSHPFHCGRKRCICVFKFETEYNEHRANNDCKGRLCRKCGIVEEDIVDAVVPIAIHVDDQAVDEDNNVEAQDASDLHRQISSSLLKLPERCYALTVRHPPMVVGTAEDNLLILNLQNLQVQAQNVVLEESNSDQVRQFQIKVWTGTFEGLSICFIGPLHPALSHAHAQEVRTSQRLGITPMAGILLHGPPGKIKCAHTIASEAGVPFYRISATETVASEENSPAPLVIFVEEIDAVTSEREDLRGIERHIIAKLLTFIADSPQADATSISGEEKPGYVLIVGATSRLDALPSDLGRPESCDREICLGILGLQGIFTSRKVNMEDLGMSMKAGFLLYGPASYSKALIAKAVADEAGSKFLYIKLHRADPAEFSPRLASPDENEPPAQFVVEILSAEDSESSSLVPTVWLSAT